MSILVYYSKSFGALNLGIAGHTEQQLFITSSANLSMEILENDPVPESTKHRRQTGRRAMARRRHYLPGERTTSQTMPRMLNNVCLNLCPKAVWGGADSSARERQLPGGEGLPEDVQPPLRHPILR